MFALIASLVFAATAIFAVGSMVHTLATHADKIAALLRTSRSIARDREFLVRMVEQGQGGAPAAGAGPIWNGRMRRLPQRAVTRRVERSGQPLHAAA